MVVMEDGPLAAKFENQLARWRWPLASGNKQTVCPLGAAAARMLGRIAVAAEAVVRPAVHLCVSI
ncbi:hypothetical protein ELI38_12445 [Rhizobium leguminosarum]|nr:hypothetical protein CHR56_22390 [Rhizobium leguminosarum bv. viciae]OOO44135.1 hypothetical protein BS629_28720 [Rhizobium leguminosarum bv. viciae USDA 2370]TAU21134.1 hypothetical protein ELI50_11405 [Rhizobium leguminosarum]NKJ79083.1 hypothetical protein [Rhizobium leguminosarum bv. viciae]NKJ93206.1 hypothetical protein [Rhizobium leguminosarum bv. viciae]